MLRTIDTSAAPYFAANSFQTAFSLLVHPLSVLVGQGLSWAVAGVGNVALTTKVPHLGKVLDIIMLAIPGGQERTEPEYRALLDKAGFHLKRVVRLGSAVSVVEAALV